MQSWPFDLVAVCKTYGFLDYYYYHTGKEQTGFL